jgi:hypothetical protein
MTTITWVIEWMSASTTEINGHTEVVLTAGWRCNGTDGAYGSTVYGTAGFPQPAEGGSFTPYADLTQDQVLGWCWSNGVNKDATETEVQDQIQTQINPPVIQPPLPWSV